MTVDSSIWDRAEETAKADHPHATEADVDKLAQAWQKAYEDWAQEIDERRDAVKPITLAGTYDADDYGVVTINGVRLSPDRSLALRNHSPTGFAWGYGGSGPAQLALAVLLEAGLSDDEAAKYYQAFKFAHITRLPQRAGFTTTIDVAAWIRDHDSRYSKR